MGDSNNRGKPTKIANPINVDESFKWDNITYYSGTSTHIFGDGNDGKKYAWGDNGYGELGVGDKRDKLVPTKVLNPIDVDNNSFK